MAVLSDSAFAAATMGGNIILYEKKEKRHIIFRVVDGASLHFIYNITKIKIVFYVLAASRLRNDSTMPLLLLFMHGR